MNLAKARCHAGFQHDSYAQTKTPADAAARPYRAGFQTLRKNPIFAVYFY